MSSAIHSHSVEGPYRLPTNVKPIHYSITIKTDLKGLTFQGLVKIEYVLRHTPGGGLTLIDVSASLNINTDTDTIVLNASDLHLGKASIFSHEMNSEYALTSISPNEKMEQIAYHLPQALPAGSKAGLKIEFDGKLTDNMIGYYRSSWDESEGNVDYYSLTNFEPTSARRAFPCWDEPLLKATFDVMLISREGTVNLSNMPAMSKETIVPAMTHTNSDLEKVFATTADGKWKITKFKTTPPMSTYTVAFANGNFNFLETSVVMPLSGKTIPLRVYTTSNVIHQAQYILDVTSAVLPIYEKIFNIEYPLPKLDTLLANDFDAGAMENWGLIMGKQSMLLLDISRPDAQSRKRVASIQIHEIAHMWFGNITTMEWWTYLYLNEGFATLMGEVLVPDKVFPDWHVTSGFIVDHFNRAMVLDAKKSSHPVEVECPDPNHIQEIFDDLSYSKAASVLRMLSNYVGEEQFLKGVSLYLKRKQFTNSVTRDLWDAISDTTGVDVSHLTDDWITKIGYPVLTVSEDEKGIHIRQDRFMETGLAGSEDNETVWNIPLSLMSMKDGQKLVDRQMVLNKREIHIPLDTSKLFKLNADTTGLFRVLYTAERLSKIAAESVKNDSMFSLNDRTGFVQDVFALSKAGMTDISVALNLIKSWKNESEYLVWQVIGNSLEDLISIWWEYPELVNKLNSFRQTLFSPLVDKLGFEYTDEDAMDTSLLRTLAINQSLAAGDKGVIAELRFRFNHYLETGDDVNTPADIQQAIFTAAVRYGGHVEYEAIKKIVNNPKTPSQKDAAIIAMGASQDLELLQETTHFITDGARYQDIPFFFRALSVNFKARRLLTKYFQSEYDLLYKRMEKSFALGNIIKYSTEYYTTEEDYIKIETFYKRKDTSKYNRHLAQALDTIRASSLYIQHSTMELEKWVTGL